MIILPKNKSARQELHGQTHISLGATFQLNTDQVMIFSSLNDK